MDRILKREPRAGGPSALAFHTSRIVTNLGVLIVLSAMSMPYVTAAGTTKDSVAGDALPVLLLLVPVFLITLVPDLTRPVPAPLGWASLLLAITAFPLAIVKYLDAGALAATLDGSVGFGPRLVILGTVVALVGIGLGLAGNLLRPLPGRTGSHRKGPTRSRTDRSGDAPGGTGRSDHTDRRDTGGKAADSRAVSAAARPIGTPARPDRSPAGHATEPRPAPEPGTR